MIRRNAALEFYGPEPIVKDKVLTEIDLIKYYNWCHAHFESEDAKKFVLKMHPKIACVLDKHHPALFVTLGWISRIMEFGGILPIRTLTWYKDKLNKLSRVEVSFDTKEEIPVMNQGQVIQSNLARQFDDVMSDFEKEIDNFWINKSTTFNPYTYLVSNEVKGFHAAKIAEYYTSHLEEVTAVLRGTDEELLAAYRVTPEVVLKKYKVFLETIINDCARMSINAKIARKPRKKKVKTASQLTSKMKYKAADDRFKIKSVQPTDIIGASQVWVFNTKTRKLGVYNALNINDKLSVKGSKVLNYDPAKSIQKTVRKPDVVLPIITQGGKVALRTVLSDINAVETFLTGRINADIVILRSVR